MTSFPQTRGALNVQETRLSQPTHSERRKENNTTQQRMTAYFPGRPPDILQELTQNPCQGWVPSESLQKFLLEVNLYNWIDKRIQ